MKAKIFAALIALAAVFNIGLATGVYAMPKDIPKKNAANVEADMQREEIARLRNKIRLIHLAASTPLDCAEKLQNVLQIAGETLGIETK